MATRDWTQIEFILVQQTLYQQNYIVSTYLGFKVIILFLDYRDIHFIPWPLPKLIFMCKKTLKWGGGVQL